MYKIIYFFFLGGGADCSFFRRCPYNQTALIIHRKWNSVSISGSLSLLPGQINKGSNFVTHPFEEAAFQPESPPLPPHFTSNYTHGAFAQFPSLELKSEHSQPLPTPASLISLDFIYLSTTRLCYL